MPTPSLEDYTPEQIEQMAATYQAILNNPATRELGLRATKAINPTSSIPELDLKDMARGEFKKLNERNDALEQQLRERDARDRIERERSALRSDGMSADDVAAIEKIMTDEHIPSYQTAAKYFKGQKQVAEPTPPAQSGYSTYTMPADPMAAMKGGKGALSKWARNSASEALNDIRAGRIQLNS